jgi:hypothetical protein
LQGGLRRCPTGFVTSHIVVLKSRIVGYRGHSSEPQACCIRFEPGVRSGACLRPESPGMPWNCKTRVPSGTIRGILDSDESEEPPVKKVRSIHHVFSLFLNSLLTEEANRAGQCGKRIVPSPPSTPPPASLVTTSRTHEPKSRGTSEHDSQ